MYEKVNGFSEVAIKRGRWVSPYHIQEFVSGDESYCNTTKGPTSLLLHTVYKHIRI